MCLWQQCLSLRVVVNELQRHGSVFMQICNLFLNTGNVRCGSRSGHPHWMFPVRNPICIFWLVQIDKEFYWVSKEIIAFSQLDICFPRINHVMCCRRTSSHGPAKRSHWRCHKYPRSSIVTPIHFEYFCILVVWASFLAGVLRLYPSIRPHKGD